jgi:GT2 family glycosyltransferase
MFLSVIIVNWNSTDFLMHCLDAFYTRTTGIRFEVIVVDNASPDNGSALIRNRFPQTIILQSHENIGFAGANNLGVTHAKGEFLLFLNPDTVVEENAVATVVRRLANIIDAGAMGCKLLNSDMTIQTSALLRFPTICNHLFTAEGLKKRFPRMRFWGIRPLFADTGSPEEVEAVSGAAMFVKREAFMAAGKFDTRFFMYSEDVDLCQSIRKNGYKVYYTGDASIVHHGGKSTRHSTINAFSVLMMRQSAYLMLIKWRGPRYAGMYKAAFSLMSIVRILLLASVFPIAFFTGKAPSIIWSLRKWSKILEWSLGLPSVSASIGKYSYNGS